MKLIGEVRINNEISGFDTMVNGEIADVFGPEGTTGTAGELLLRFPGIWTPDQLNVPYVDFGWDGTNDNGQQIGNGVYYIKVTVTDEYGHIETTTKEVQLLRIEEYTRISIYNTAGEVMSRLVMPSVQVSSIDLSGMDDILYVGGGAVAPIKYGNGLSMNWDGTNFDGETVSNGIYEIVVETKTSTGFTTVAAKTVTVLSTQGDSFLTDPTGALKYPKTYPNPYVIDDTIANPSVAIDWFAAVPGTIEVRIYNMAGELVRRLKGDLAVKPLTWDFTTQSGEAVSSGLFVIVVRGVTDDGRRETAVVKFAVIRAGEYQ